MDLDAALAALCPDLELDAWERFTIDRKWRKMLGDRERASSEEEMRAAMHKCVKKLAKTRERSQMVITIAYYEAQLEMLRRAIGLARENSYDEIMAKIRALDDLAINIKHNRKRSRAEEVAEEDTDIVEPLPKRECAQQPPSPPQ